MTHFRMKFTTTVIIMLIHVGYEYQFEKATKIKSVKGGNLELSSDTLLIIIGV